MPRHRLALVVVALFIIAPAFADKKTIVGRVEVVEFPELGFKLESRIDTGARTCSMHVSNEKFSGKGKDRYIEFDTATRDGKVHRVRAKVHRVARIRNTGGTVNERIVIRQTIKIGKISRKVSINLNDRTELKYNFLVGRNFLRGKFLVDVSRSHVHDE